MEDITVRVVDGQLQLDDGEVISDEEFMDIYYANLSGYHLHHDIRMRTMHTGPSVIVMGSTAGLMLWADGYSVHHEVELVPDEAWDLLTWSDTVPYDAIVPVDNSSDGLQYDGLGSIRYDFIVPNLPNTWLGVPHGEEEPLVWYGLKDPHGRIGNEEYEVYVRLTDGGWWTLSLTEGDGPYQVRGPIKNDVFGSKDEALHYLARRRGPWLRPITSFSDVDIVTN